ncbi:MAG: zinc ribbon domain-containing protein [Candidatus Krumholzibacteriota bacterium]|nr:zinc ribbon domain-containing protein [Candidatus Krumholzibacteriota bacterium]
MYCQHCGKELEEGGTFCVYCGKGSREESRSRGMYGHELTKLKIPEETRNPGVAAAIGFFLGWIMLGPVGYVYLGQWNWFWLTFVIQIFAVPLTAGVAYVVLPVVFAIHQYQMARELNDKLLGKRVDGAGTGEAGGDRWDKEDQ